MGMSASRVDATEGVIIATDLTDAEKLALVDKHAMCELEKDWAGALETLTDDAYYDFFPMGLRVAGPEGITYSWEKMFNAPVLAESKLDATVMKTWIREDTAIGVVQFPVGVEETITTTWAVYEFSGRLIQSETVFYDHVLAPLIDPVFDAKLRGLPGSSQLEVIEVNPQAG